MSLVRTSLGRWLVVLAVCAVAGSVLEVFLRAATTVLLTPLVVSVVALLMAFRLHLRNAADQRLHRQQLQQASSLQMATIEALAVAIDARARHSTSQLRREQALAGALGEAVGLSPGEVEGLRTAALLHDVGHLAVPDQILAKRGPLTDFERTRMHVHPAIGAEIIADVPFPYPVASLVRSHHERWDGTGYPARLRGSEIPLGARILAVVDHFAALTSDRAFKRALPIGDAVNVLWTEAGKALDPAVVARFVELLPTLGDLAAPAEPRPAIGGTGPSPVDAAFVVRNPRVALADIAGANTELRALYEVAEALGSSLGVADAMNVLASKLQAVIPFSTCALFLHDATDDVSRCRFAAGVGSAAFTDLVFDAGTSLVGRAIDRRECVTSTPVSTPLEPRPFDLPAEGLRSVLVCPLGAGDTVLGALALYHTAPEYFTSDHRRLALRMSDQIAAVIYNSLVFERTQEESVTDALTGLPNTRYLFPHLNRELARARRLGSPMAVLVLDLDGLKHINDTFGHTSGDRALCAVAAGLRGTVRPYDICARYGGDEFIILLSDCGRDQADAKRSELQRAIDALVFGADDGTVVRLSISVGAAVFPDDGDTYDRLLSEADSRMYRDKADRKRAAV